MELQKGTYKKICIETRYFYHNINTPLIGYTTLSTNLLLDIPHCLKTSYWIYHIVYTSLIGYTTLSTHLLLDIPHCLHISNWIYHIVYKPLIGYTTLSTNLLLLNNIFILLFLVGNYTNTLHLELHRHLMQVCFRF